MSESINVNLLLPLNDNHSELALSVPLTQCATFATTPLKWLRFVGFTIYGRQGYLSMSMNGVELDYMAQIEPRSYYFISDAEPRFADIDAINTGSRTATTSDDSTGRAGFRQRVSARDITCVLTGELRMYCQACHIIPHSKGDDYMLNLFTHRRETYGLEVTDLLNDINDTRNGILLQSSFHPALDHGYIAFLKTPNFALSVDDIPYQQQPQTGSPTSRFTLQHIQPSQLGAAIPMLAPNNSDARQPENISQWPGTITVDLLYGAAALKAWGPAAFIDRIREKSKNSYYDYEGGDEEGDEGNDTSGDPTPDTFRQPTPRYKTRSVTNPQAIDTADQPTMGDMFDVVLALWRQPAREGKRKLPGGDGADVVNTKNKVQTWLQSMEGSTS